MNRKLFVLCFVIISMLVLFTGCTKQNNIEDFKLGRYVIQEDTGTEGWSWVLLKENSQFEFNRGITSYRPEGTYSIKDGMLILYVNEDESYVFTIDGDYN